MNFTVLLKKELIIPVAVGVISFASGLGAGYALGRKKGGEDTSDNHPSRHIIDEEDYNKLMDDPEYVRLLAEEEAIEAEAENVEEIIEVQEVEEETVRRVNVFPAGNDDWDDAAERAARVEGEPYVIPVAEFMQNPYEFHQETLTYYQGDDIVSDQADQLIYNHSDLLGELKFGHGSGDKSTVYIRNEGIRREWEVCLHPGFYQIEVAGLEIEEEYAEKDLKHSSNLKFRDD